MGTLILSNHTQSCHSYDLKLETITKTLFFTAFPAKTPFMKPQNLLLVMNNVLASFIKLTATYRIRVPVLWSRLKLSEHIDWIDILANIIYYILPKTETSFISKTLVL